jgi:DNA-binding protein YbaB
MSAMYEQYEAALRQLGEQQQTLDRTQRELADLRVTAQSRDRLVSVTLNARGELTSLVFTGTRHRTLAPAQLSKAVIDTYAAARAELDQRLAALYGPVVPVSMDLGSAFAGRLDLTEMFRQGLTSLGLSDYINPPHEPEKEEAA